MIDQSEIHAADEARRSAMIAGDVATLSELFADEMIWIHASARVDTKAGLLDSISSGKMRYLAIDTSDETLRVVNDVALLSAIAVMKVEIGDDMHEIENRYTIIWASIEGKWRVVNWQSTTARASRPS